MFSQVSFDIVAALADKENVGTAYQPSQKSAAPLNSPMRTPLGDVHNTPQGRLMKRQQYSPATPRGFGKMGRSRSLGRQPSNQAGLLNAVLFKEAFKAQQTTTQGLQAELSEKEKIIESLESRLQPVQDSSPVTPPPSIDVPETAPPTCPSPEQDTPTCPSSEQAPPTCPSSEQAPPTCPSPEQAPPTCPSPEQDTPTCPSSEQAPPTCPSPEQAPPTCPSSEQAPPTCPSLDQAPTSESLNEETSDIAALDVLCDEDFDSTIAVHGSDNEEELGSDEEELQENMGDNDYADSENHSYSPIKPDANFTKSLEISLLELNLEGNQLESNTGEGMADMFGSPQRTSSHGCSPHPTPRPLKPFSEDDISKPTLFRLPSHSECTGNTNRRGSVDVACSPIRSQIDIFHDNYDSHIPVHVSRSLSVDVDEESNTNVLEVRMDMCSTNDTRDESVAVDLAIPGLYSPPQKAYTIPSLTDPTSKIYHDAGVGGSTPLKKKDFVTTPKVYHDAAVGCSPLNIKDVIAELGDLVVTADVNCGTTPVRVRSSGTETEAFVESVGTCYTPIQTRSFCCGDGEVEMDSKGTEMTPVYIPPARDSATMVTPIRMTSTSTCHTPPPSPLHAATNTSPPPSTSHMSTGTDTVTMGDAVTMVTPIKTCDTGAGSCEPPVTSETETSMTPVSQKTSGTTMTPLQYRQTNLYSMLESLHSEYTRSHDYQVLYTESQQKVAELEAQLQCYTSLTPLLEETNASQAEAGKNLESSFKHIRSLIEKNNTERERLTEERAVFESEREENGQLVQAAMEEYASMKEEYTTFHDRTTAAEEKAQQSETMLKEVEESLSAANKENMEQQEKIYTLEAELTKTKEQLKTFQGGFKDARQKNESLQQAYINLQRNYKKLESSHKENMEFMESEHSALREEYMETSQSLTEQLTESNTQLQQARQVISELEEELEATKNKAHLHAMALNAEITDSILASGKLSEKLVFLYEQLCISAKGMQMERKEDKAEEQEKVEDANMEAKVQSGSSASFLASVLCAINDKADPDAADPAPAPAPAPSIGSSSSAFTRLPTNQIASPGSCDEEGMSKEEEEEEQELGSEEEMPLNEQILEMVDVAEDVWNVIRQIQDSVLQKNTALSKTIAQLEEKLEESRDVSGRQLRAEQQHREELEKRLQDTQQTELMLRKEVNEARERARSGQADLANARQLLIQKADRMQELVDQTDTLKKAESEIQQLRQKLLGKERECELMQVTLDGALTKFGDREKDARTIFMLRKEVSSLRSQLGEMREQAHTLAAKANSRTMTYEQNLKKAEREIAVLDNMIEKTRQVVLRHRDEAMLWPEMRRLWPEWIGGEYPLATPTPHKHNPMH